MEKETKCTVIYDSECTLCVRFRKALELIDIKKDVSFLSLHDPKTFISYPELNKEDCEESIHLVKQTGEVLVAGDALSYLITILPGVKKFSWLLDSESGQNATKAFYRRINEMRVMRKRKCYTCGRPKMRE